MSDELSALCSLSSSGSSVESPTPSRDATVEAVVSRRKRKRHRSSTRPSAKKRAAQSKNVRKRKWRQVSGDVAQLPAAVRLCDEQCGAQCTGICTARNSLECRLCGRPLSVLLLEREVGRLLPCGHLFCNSGGGSEGCCGIYNTMLYPAVWRLPAPHRCPFCKAAASTFERLGPLSVVESEEIPIVSLSNEEIASLQVEPMESWGTDREEPAEVSRSLLMRRRKEAADARRLREADTALCVVGEEWEYRQGIMRRLCSEGVVDLLREQAALRRLDAALRPEKAVGVKWFTSRLLSDANEMAGGTDGLLLGEFAPVARCCGPGVKPSRRSGGGREGWCQQDREEAVSFVLHRMIEGGVWPPSVAPGLKRVDRPW
jgi:hypothetical protein